MAEAKDKKADAKAAGDKPAAADKTQLAAAIESELATKPASDHLSPEGGGTDSAEDLQALEAANALIAAHGRKQAERARARVGQPLLRTNLERLVKDAGDDVLMCMSPQAFTVTLDDHTQVVIPAGPVMLPRTLVEHWYVKAHKVTPFEVQPPRQTVAEDVKTRG